MWFVKHDLCLIVWKSLMLNKLSSTVFMKHISLYYKRVDGSQWKKLYLTEDLHFPKPQQALRKDKVTMVCDITHFLITTKAKEDFMRADLLSSVCTHVGL